MAAEIKMRHPMSWGSTKHIVDFIDETAASAAAAAAARTAAARTEL